MTNAASMVEIWRGGMIESRHFGHAVVCDETGDIVESWGDPDLDIYPRSSFKMIQALPLIESGAADKAGLTAEHLALACASHTGAAIHTDRVRRWLATLALSEVDLRCGPQMPEDPDAHERLLCRHDAPGQVHNNCSGKHTGFLTLNRHLGGGPEYIDIDHPVQKAVRAALEDVTGEACPRYGIDGCSAPNFVTSLRGLAGAMARFAAAGQNDVRSRAMVRLREAMMRHPELIAGEGRFGTSVTRALAGRGVVKSGAEGVYVAILPALRLGIALKIVDGASRASECAMAAILARLGVLDPASSAARAVLDAPILNRRNIVCGAMRPSPTLSPA